jgi:ankyrin repeat protein
MLEAMKALYRGDEEEAHRLLPPDHELTAHEAATFGRVDRLRELLDEDPSRVNEFSPDGFSPLHGAIYGGHDETVRLLIERGADLEAVSTSEVAQVRPLGTAAFVRSVELGRMLLEAGADANAQNPNGHTALDTALESGDEAFAALLREFGADES